MENQTALWRHSLQVLQGLPFSLLCEQSKSAEVSQVCWQQ
jgi:hypothetical protein